MSSSRSTSLTRRPPGPRRVDERAPKVEARPGAPAPPPAPTKETELPEGAVELKGVSARIAENMEASLAVPTATSVRSIPAKLLEENRRIINRYLGQRHGGKVSFTHLIGCAIVRGARGPARDEGRATSRSTASRHLVQNKHVNFGLAVDVEKKDGSRVLLRAEHQGRAGPRLRRFLGRVRGTDQEGARQQADSRGLRRHDRDAYEPGHGRHGAVRPAPDEGAGADRRDRRDPVPARVRGSRPALAGRHRGQQGHHDHVDLRPSRDPGGRVGRVPELHPRAAARHRSLLRRDLRLAEDPVRAGALEPRRIRRWTTRSCSRSSPGSSS